MASGTGDNPVALGMLFGMMIGQLALGLSFGAAAGVVIGAIVESNRRKDQQPPDASE
jgi:hypothetical protein